MYISVGSRIRNIRGKESRANFAEKLGIGTTTLQRYENDERAPELDFLIKLHDITGYSLDYLVYGKETAIDAEEALILEKFRSTNSEIKTKMLMLLLGAETDETSKNDAMIKDNSRVHNPVDGNNEAVDSAVYSEKPGTKVKAKKIGVLSDNGKVKIKKLEM